MSAGPGTRTRIFLLGWPFHSLSLSVYDYVPLSPTFMLVYSTGTGYISPLMFLVTHMRESLYSPEFITQVFIIRRKFVFEHFNFADLLKTRRKIPQALANSGRDGKNQIIEYFNVCRARFSPRRPRNCII